MRTSSIRARLLPLGFAVVTSVLAHGSEARAETDTFGLGTGRDGALIVTSAAGTVVNTYAPVTAAVAAGAKTVTVGARVGAAATFTAGQTVMLLQSRGGFAAAPVSGSGTTITLTGANKTGRYELARIASVAGNVLTLTHATVNAFDANDTQLISVPEYTTVTVNAAAKLVGRAWDGASGTGGVLAFLAKGAVSNAGTIDVSGLGFAGGVRVTTAGSLAGCASEDGTPGAGGNAGGGAHKGEGLDPSGYSTLATYVGGAARNFGRGNVANGGGGGDCFNAGGGGGGHGGAGGAGGDTNANVDARRTVGGRGGAPASYDPAVSLVFGGGGGAGEDDDGVGGRGGVGGGVFWMRADSLAGAGTIASDGTNGLSAGPAGNPTFADGGGGGGAGGGVFLTLHANANCGGITARGGKGGDALPGTGNRNYGPGGGGAGGRVRVASAGGVCNATTTSGVAGATSGGAYGAAGGGAGTTATGGAFAATACDVTTGKCGGCVNDTFCPPAAPTCVTAVGATQFTCVAGPVTPAPYGDPPAGGAPCTAGATPTQGTSPGCVNNLCDKVDDRCGYANNTICSAGAQCRSTICHTDGRCGLPDGTACAVDLSCRSGKCTNGICGTGGGADAGRDGSASDSGSGSSGADASTDDEAASLEGGGISCNTTNASSSSVLTLVGLAGFVAMAIRRGRRRRP